MRPPIVAGSLTPGARTTPPFGATAVKALVAQFELQQKPADERIAAAVRAQTTLAWTLGVICLVLMTPLALIWRVSGSIGSRLLSAEGSARSIAAGDLTRTQNLEMKADIAAA